MPTLAQALLSARQEGAQVDAYTAELTDATTVTGDTTVVNATGRTAAAGKTAVVLRVGHVHIMVGFYG
ncbi:hypothetical protein [Streptomyces alboflavus]|uniref:hypothetical protein n=1 Tax=Streptomyces alboflavus TaxID=67267 RepID=UPI00368D5EDC